jgi:hypothetical protein
MAYSALKWATANSRPTTQKSQPMGLSGGVRGATTAPTLEKAIAASVLSTQWSKICPSG